VPGWRTAGPSVRAKAVGRYDEARRGRVNPTSTSKPAARSEPLVADRLIASSSKLVADFCSCRACKPNFVCHRSGMTVIPLGRALLRGSSDLPGSCDAPSRHVHAPKRATPPLFGLAPCGVCPAVAITGGAVRSYRTFSPLPRSANRMRRYVLCCTFRKRPLTAAPRTLSGTPLYGVRTFLCALAPTATVRPSS
jgi:hypothetical protein